MKLWNGFDDVNPEQHKDCLISVVFELKMLGSYASVAPLSPDGGTALESPVESPLFLGFLGGLLDFSEALIKALASSMRSLAHLESSSTCPDTSNGEC